MHGLITKPPFEGMGTLYTLGYAQTDAASQVERFMCHEHALLVDIRYSPRSRWRPEWNRSTLTATYGRRYVWDRRLGNINYQHREHGIQLAEGYMDAIHVAAALLCQGTSLILLCACKDARTCHLSLVAKLIQDAVQEVLATTTTIQAQGERT